MNKESSFQKLITSIGKNNQALYAVVAIAVAKGIFRPVFTMMDKEQDKKSKQYAALREGLTEVIAIPTYIVLNTICNKAAPMFIDKKKVKTGTLTLNNKRTFDDILNLDSKKSNETLVKKQISKLSSHEQNLFKDYKSKLEVVKTTTSFTGICLSALIVIPALCNILLPHILRVFEQQKDKKDLNKELYKTKNPINFTGLKNTTILRKKEIKNIDIYPSYNVNNNMRIGT